MEQSTQKKILIAEDETTIAIALTMALEQAGYKVTLASDGEAAMAELKKERPDLILLDIVMPKKDGLQVLEEVKRDPAFNDIPVVLLTNLSDTEHVSKGVSLGAVGYLIKAYYSSQEVVEKVRQVLAGT
ncbi:MAG: response regulator [Parcubacteria group bacterium]|nr:response regulator [Parcubacteria group bacterium]